MKPGFLADNSATRDADRAALVAYLLSIDEDAETVTIPPLGSQGGDFCRVP